MNMKLLDPRHKIKKKKSRRDLAEQANVLVSWYPAAQLESVERPLWEYRCFIVPGDIVVELTVTNDEGYEAQARYAWNLLKPVRDAKIDKKRGWTEVRLDSRPELVTQDFTFIIDLMRRKQDADFYAYSQLLEKLLWLVQQNEVDQKQLEPIKGKMGEGQSLSSNKNNSVCDYKNLNYMKEMLSKQKLYLQSKSKEQSFDRKSQLQQKSSSLNLKLAKKLKSRKQDVNIEQQKQILKDNINKVTAQEMRALEFDFFVKVELPEIIHDIIENEKFFSYCVYNCSEGLIKKKLHQLILSDAATEILDGSPELYVKGVMRRGWGDPSNAAERRAATQYQIYQFSAVLEKHIESKLIESTLNDKSNSDTEKTNSQFSPKDTQQQQQFSESQSFHDIQDILNLEIKKGEGTSSSENNTGIKLNEQDQNQIQNSNNSDFTKHYFDSSGQPIVSEVFGQEVQEQDISIRSFDGFSVPGKVREITVLKHSGSQLIAMTTLYIFTLPEDALDQVRKFRNENDIEYQDMNQFEYDLQVKKFIKKFNIK